ncbi:MAG: hypothetical protein IRY91_15145, partial [Gemmatimonadaceae bacterium]|nr:hypothetical protein [Gemmatimonadaceae bacterium]
EPDRRLVPERFENLRKYDGDGRLTAPLQAFLVDKAGVIAWSAFMQPDQERLIDAMLSALITSGTHATS